MNFDPLETIKIKTLIGPDLKASLTNLIDNPAFKFSHFEPLFQHNYTNANLNKTALYPTVMETLTTLSKQNKNIFVLTNKPEAQAIKICTQLNISQFMLEIIGPDTYEPKPSPKAIYNIITHYNLDKEKMVMIGDTEIDIQTSKAANIASISVTYGYRNKEELSPLNPTYIIDSLIEIFNL